MKTEASRSACTPVFMDCFNFGMIGIILPVILYLYFRHAISNVDFLFVTNNPVIFFQDNVIDLLTFTMQKGAESRAEFTPVFCVGQFLCEVLFYRFLSKRGAGITLLICFRKVAY